ncbi:hypothetical protein HMN09_01163700 [Mycena chlorophos]|uniref:Uncharacterized protein n=1 Tax=Mycena chlorophos TaxID=658473 RepID=A0A8H6S8V4_MYCCL|nr:hypothetical protein HMN09_01163700 [Mycena chlorophos]
MSTDYDDEMDLDPQTPRTASPVGHRDQATTPKVQINNSPEGVHGSSGLPRMSLAEMDEIIDSAKSSLNSQRAAQTEDSGSQSISGASGSTHGGFGLPHFLANEHGHFPDYLSHQHHHTSQLEPPHAHAAVHSHATQADNFDRADGVRSFGSEPALGSSQSISGNLPPSFLGQSSNALDALHHHAGHHPPALNIPAASSSSNTGFLFPFEEQRPLPNSGFPPPSLMAQLDLVRIEPAASANRVPDLVLDGTAWDRNMPSLRISSTSSPLPIASGSGSGSSWSQSQPPAASRPLPSSSPPSPPPLSGRVRAECRVQFRFELKLALARGPAAARTSPRARPPTPGLSEPRIPLG